MKLVALTYGTEGDTRPVAALCRALMNAGTARAGGLRFA